MSDRYLLALYISGTLIMVVFAVMMVVFLIINKQRQTRAREEKQQLEFSYKQSLMRSKIEMQEQALAYVSQEIHDNVGQVLSFSCMQIANIRTQLPDSKQKEQLEDNLEIIRQSVKELRLLSHSLNTSLVEKRDIEDAIESELKRIRSFTTIKCDLEIVEQLPDLTPEMRLLLFRITQEALQNVVKHSRAKAVKITLHHEDGRLNLMIADNGKGIDPAKLNSHVSAGVNGTHSLGMANMKQRTQLMNGTFDVASTPQTGTSISISVPV